MNTNIAKDIKMTEYEVSYNECSKALLSNKSILANILKKSGEIIKLIINTEAQNEYYVGYPLIRRAVYYACRQISVPYGLILL